MSIGFCAFKFRRAECFFHWARQVKAVLVEGRERRASSNSFWTPNAEEMIGILSRFRSHFRIPWSRTLPSRPCPLASLGSETLSLPVTNPRLRLSQTLDERRADFKKWKGRRVRGREGWEGSKGDIVQSRVSFLCVVCDVSPLAREGRDCRGGDCWRLAEERAMDADAPVEAAAARGFAVVECHADGRSEKVRVPNEGPQKRAGCAQASEVGLREPPVHLGQQSTPCRGACILADWDKTGHGSFVGAALETAWQRCRPAEVDGTGEGRCDPGGRGLNPGVGSTWVGADEGVVVSPGRRQESSRDGGQVGRVRSRRERGARLRQSSWLVAGWQACKDIDGSTGFLRTNW